MTRRRFVMLAAVAAVVVIGVAVGLLTRGGGDAPDGRSGDALAEALSYAPASSAVVLAVDTDPDSQQRKALADLVRTFPGARFAADQVSGVLSRAGLKPDDLDAVLGGPVVVAGPQALASTAAAALTTLSADPAALLRTGATAAVEGRSASKVSDVIEAASGDGRLREAGSIANGKMYAFKSGVLTRRGATLVLAGDAASLRRAITLHDRGGGMTRAAFEARLGPLNGPALVRAVARPRALIGPRAAGVPWVDALRDGALALRIEEPGARLRVHLATDPARVRPQDLPLAPGPIGPRPAPGASPAAAGLRGAAQTIAVLNSARGELNAPFLTPYINALSAIDRYKGVLDKVGGIDVDALLGQLTGTTTLTSEPAGIAIRAELRDGGRWRAAFGRLAAIPDFAIDLLDVTSFNIAGAGRDTWEIRDGGRTVARVAVVGNVLAASTDLNIDLNAIARRPPRNVPPRGALAGRVTARRVQDLIVERLGLPPLATLVLGGFGDLVYTARAERSGLDVDAALTLLR